MNSQRRRSKLRQRDFGLEAFHVERDERLDVASLRPLARARPGLVQDPLVERGDRLRHDRDLTLVERLEAAPVEASCERRFD